MSKWIGRLETRDKLASSYEFKLLYRDTWKEIVNVHIIFRDCKLYNTH